MTPTDEQIDALIDDALAAESSEITDRLAQQIVLLTDDALSASLDAAIGPMDVSDGLVDRILLETSVISGSSGALGSPSGAVLAKIGPTVGWLLAASVVLAVGWLGWVTIQQSVPVDQSVASVMSTGSMALAADVLADDEIGLELEMITLALDDFVSGDTFADHEMFDLEWQVMLDARLDGPMF